MLYMESGKCFECPKMDGNKSNAMIQFKHRLNKLNHYCYTMHKFRRGADRRQQACCQRGTWYPLLQPYSFPKGRSACQPTWSTGSKATLSPVGTGNWELLSAHFSLISLRQSVRERERGRRGRLTGNSISIKRAYKSRVHFTLFSLYQFGRARGITTTKNSWNLQRT